MAALTERRSVRPTPRAELFGPAWGSWRGGWQSSRRLVGRAREWVLEKDGRETSRWPSLPVAIAELWRQRSVRGAAPWGIGWLGYEACAELAGGLPVRPFEGAYPRGVVLVEPQPVAATPRGIIPAADGCGSARWSLDKAAFRTAVGTVRERIAGGDVYQVNLSRRMTVDEWSGTSDALLEVSSLGGVPDYHARLQFDEGELVTASMELLLRRRGTLLETHPIKGTRPRGRSEVRDRELAAELDADPKERAELAMIVDLERNDLGRISQTGSIRVADAGTVRTFPGVHHRIAKVTGQLRPGLEWWEALAAVVPGGSVTGCPKIAAMSVIAELEPVPRGPFTGALGVIGGDGDMEMALLIRSAWSYDGRLEFAAGCGIVWESDPAAEEAESRVKVSRWLDLVEASE